MSRYPYVDRNPCIVAAGKPDTDVYSTTAKELFRDIKLQDKVDALIRQFGLVDSKDYGADLNRSVKSNSCVSQIKECLAKPIPTFFQAIDEEVKNTIYDSYWNKALGKSRDPTPGLPIGMNPMELTFGKATVLDEPAGLAINPRKPSELILEEDKQFHDLYKFSHQNYYPGEQVCRDYSSAFSRNRLFGKATNIDKSGIGVKRCLNWFNNDPISNVSRRQAAVRNRTLPVLGKGLDKTGVTDVVPSNFTFGLPSSDDNYGVEELMYECPRSLVRRDMKTFLAYVNKIRLSVFHKINLGEFNLEDLFDEMQELYRKENPDGEDCTLSLDCIDYILKKHRIYIDRNKLEPLLLILELLKEDGKIKIIDFIKIIDRNSPFPDLKREHYIMPPDFQNCKGTSSVYQEHPKKPLPECMPPAGFSPTRLEGAVPYYIETVVNMDHLSEETTARTLISPSIYTQYGLSHRDFFKPRTKEFLNDLFKKINVTLPEKDLDEIYQEGLDLDKTGGVCIETFRNLLDERAYRAYCRI